MDWAPACEPRGHWFDSWLGHMPGLRARPSVGGVQQATAHWCFSPSLSPSLPLSLKINKKFFLNGIFNISSIIALFFGRAVGGSVITIPRVTEEVQRLCLNTGYVIPILCKWDVFQNPQWTPEATGSTNPSMYMPCVFSRIHACDEVMASLWHIQIASIALVLLGSLVSKRRVTWT